MIILKKKPLVSFSFCEFIKWERHHSVSVGLVPNASISLASQVSLQIPLSTKAPRACWTMEQVLTGVHDINVQLKRVSIAKFLFAQVASVRDSFAMLVRQMCRQMWPLKEFSGTIWAFECNCLGVHSICVFLQRSLPSEGLGTCADRAQVKSAACVQRIHMPFKVVLWIQFSLAQIAGICDSFAMLIRQVFG